GDGVRAVWIVILSDEKDLFGVHRGISGCGVSPILPLDGPRERTKPRGLRISRIQRIFTDRSTIGTPPLATSPDVFCSTTSRCFGAHEATEGDGCALVKRSLRSLRMERMPHQERSVASGRSVKSVIPLVLYFVWQDWPRRQARGASPEIC